LQPQAVTISYSELKSTILSIISLVLSKINKTFNLPEVLVKYPFNYLESLSTVLLQELTRYNTLIELIQESLSKLQEVYDGHALINSENEKLAESLLKNKVPESWIKISYASCKNLVSYIDDLHKRVSFFEEWISNGRPNVFWISGFFFTQSFLTGVLQEYARKFSLPIDTLEFQFEVLEKAPGTRPDIGVYVDGLFLEGASWDGKCLQESRPRELYCEFPVLWLKPSQERRKLMNERYICPVYRTLLRTGTHSITGHSSNFIFSIALETTINQSHWVKRGVALFTQLDD